MSYHPHIIVSPAFISKHLIYIHYCLNIQNVLIFITPYTYVHVCVDNTYVQL